MKQDRYKAVIDQQTSEIEELRKKLVQLEKSREGIQKKYDGNEKELKVAQEVVKKNSAKVANVKSRIVSTVYDILT